MVAQRLRRRRRQRAATKALLDLRPSLVCQSAQVARCRRSTTFSTSSSTFLTTTTPPQGSHPSRPPPSRPRASTRPCPLPCSQLQAFPHQRGAKTRSHSSMARQRPTPSPLQVRKAITAPRAAPGLATPAMLAAMVVDRKCKCKAAPQCCLPHRQPAQQEARPPGRVARKRWATWRRTTSCLLAC